MLFITAALRGGEQPGARDALGHGAERDVHTDGKLERLGQLYLQGERWITDQRDGDGLDHCDGGKRRADGDGERVADERHGAADGELYCDWR